MKNRTRNVKSCLGALLLAILMVLQVVPFSAFADTVTDTTTVTDGTGDGTVTGDGTIVENPDADETIGGGGEDGEEEEKIDYDGLAVDVYSAEELEFALAEQSPIIRLANGFELDRTFYVTAHTVIFAASDLTLLRSADFGGDLFVVGEASDGTLTEEPVSLTFGRPDLEEGPSMTVDGNGDAMNVDVVGTVFFVCNGCTLNLIGDNTFTANRKVGNEKVLTGDWNVSYPIRIGGAVAIITKDATLNILGGTFSDNAVADIVDDSTEEGQTCTQGGVIYNYGVTNIVDATFSGNRAARGGALYNYRTMHIYSATIENNAASDCGGAIYVPASTVAYLYIGEESSLTDSYVSFVGNTAVTHGGAIVAQNSLTLSNAVFRANTAGTNGGAISAGGITAELENVTFESNTAATYGGAIYLSTSNGKDDYELTARACSFEGNTATRGGAVYAGASTRAYFEQVEMTGNSAAYGAAIYQTNSTVEVNGGAFTSNTATTYGGVTSMHTNATAVYNAVTATGNSGDTAGFAYLSSGAALTVYNSHLKQNVSAKAGGAVYVAAECTFNAYKTVFEENSAQSNGGAIFYYTGGTENILHSCTFLGNVSGNFGGAIYFSNASVVNMYSTVATGNTAGTGGFLYITTTGTVVTLAATTVSGNTASVGGPIIWGNSTGAKLYIDKVKYFDKDYTGEWDETYWTSAIVNKLKVYDKDVTLPSYADYGTGEIIEPEVPITTATVSTADGLESALEKGINYIRITASFELDRTFYISRTTTIYTLSSVTLTRAPGFAGDLFVVGEDAEGNLNENGVTLTLGNPESTEEGLLVIDGNRDNLTVAVTGSALFLTKGATVDLWHNVTICNHYKTGNEKTLTGDYSLSYYGRIGGAVAIVAGGASMNIYGGIYSGNAVLDITDGDTDEGQISSQGGVFYNYGTMKVYGGTFEGNHAGRAGVFYNYRVMYIYNAVIQNNTASNLGGAIYMPASTAAFLYIGEENDVVTPSVSFIGNTSLGNGGAIYAQKVVSIKNAIFRGNHATTYGGAISANAPTLTVAGCLFEENTTDKYGGAIYVTGSNGKTEGYEVAVRNSTFKGNSVTGLRGGAIYMSAGSRVYFYNCVLDANVSTSQGAALYANGGTVEMNRVDILNHTSAASAGGAIYLLNQAYALMNRVTATGNESKTGGFLYLTEARADIYNSIFRENTASNGGVAYVYYDGILNVYGTLFEENEATVTGGALFYYTNGAEGSLIHSSTFRGNVAEEYAGGIYFSKVSVVTIYNITGENNSAVKGGFLYITTTGTVVNLVGSTVSGNTASTGGPIIWGNSKGATLNIDKSKHTDLDVAGPYDSAYWAAAIYNSLTVSGITEDIPKYLDYGNEPYDNLIDATDVSTPEELEAALAQGIAHIRIVADMTVDRTFYVWRDTVLFATAPVTLTRAPDFAGDMLVVGQNAEGVSTLLMDGTVNLTLGNPLSTTEHLLTFDGNADNMQVDTAGSVLFVCYSATVDVYSGITVTDCHKVANERTYDESYVLSRPNRVGGAFAVVASGTLNVYGGNYLNNSVRQEEIITDDDSGRDSTVGGLIYNNANLYIMGGHFENNLAARGGIVYSYRYVKILGGTFQRNGATVNGGVYYAPNSAGVHLYIGDVEGIVTTPVVFQENWSVGHGGVLYSSPLNATVIYGNTSFIGNYSTEGSGGAICMYGQLTVRDCVFEGNTAYNRGGAMYICNSSDEYITRLVEVTRCEFRGNAATAGGALFLYASNSGVAEGANVTVTDCTFEGNMAPTSIAGKTSAYGGAIAADRRATLTVVNSTFKNNTADTEGGALYLVGESVTTVTGSVFESNAIVGTNGTHGGAIVVRSSYLTVRDSDFIGNTSLANGGAIYVSYQSSRPINSKVIISDCTFTSNASEGSGGALYATRQAVEEEWRVLDIRDTAFEENTAGGHGGALYITSTETYLRNVTFLRNAATTEETSNAGALCAGAATLVMDTVTFEGNSASKYGGAFYFTGTTATLYSVTATANTAVQLAGVGYATKATLTIYDSTLTANTAASNGGALYLTTNCVSAIYNTVFSGNVSGASGGALMIYTGADGSTTLHDCTFEGNTGVLGTVYISNASPVSIYNLTARNNTAEKGGALYITTTGTAVNLAGLVVSGNTATVGGPVIWGNSAGACLYIDKTQYVDEDATGALDDAYWAEAIYNALTVEEVSLEIPTYLPYEREVEETETPAAPKTPVTVDKVFQLGESSSDGYINDVYDKLPVLDNSSNFMSDQVTVFEDINGGTVTVDTFVYQTKAPDGNCTVGEGLLLYQAMLYKQAHPDEEVNISLSAYRLSVAAAVNVNRNSRYFGYMRNLYGQEYDKYGFVRMAYLLVCAAKMGINVTVIGQLDGYPANTADPDLYHYFTGHLSDPCDPAYAEGVVGDYMNFRFCNWTLVAKGGTDMMHTKMCTVSHYLDMNGVEHRNAVFTSSSNLDGINSNASNGNWKLQTATIITGHAELYRVACNYLQLVAQYCGQEQVYEFQDLVNVRNTKQIALLLAGQGDQIPEDEQIVYLGSENDSVFELYFTPMGGGTHEWNETTNAYAKYLRELYNSEGSILFVWNAAEYSNSYTMGKQLESVIVGAFYKNKNPENAAYGRMEHFDATVFDGLEVGVDIGYVSFNQLAFGEVHNKDMMLSYVKDGQRYYVTLHNSMNPHSGSMYYQSNFMLVIKETDCDEDSVFFTMADRSTTGIVDHAWGEEQTFIPESGTEHGYTYRECEVCGKTQVTGTVHLVTDWIVDREATEEQSGIQHKECTVCGAVLTSKEVVISDTVKDVPVDAWNGVSFTASTASRIPLTLAGTPHTLEATVQVPLGMTDRAGVIVSNYDGGTGAQISLEIYTYGRVRLFFYTGESKVDCIFDTDIRSPEQVSLAVTVEGTLATLYVEGEARESKQLTAELPDVSGTFYIGGDERHANSQYFKGVVYSVSLFGDVRQQAELKQDLVYVTEKTEGLLYSRHFESTNRYGSASDVDGQTFDKDSVSHIGNLEGTPHTIEAVIQVPKEQSDRAGVIVGNYDGGTGAQMNLEIYYGGTVRLFVNTGSAKMSCVFATDIRSLAPMHIAVTVDGTLVTLYIKGDAVETRTLDETLPTVTDNYCVGGDAREDGSQYFKGTVYALHLFEDVRTPEEIRQDMRLVDQGADALLYTGYFQSTTGDRTDATVGQTFDKDTVHSIGKLTATPYTMEATLQVPTSMDDRAGVVIGNYNGISGKQINLEVYTLGRLRLYLNTGTEVFTHTFATDIRSDTRTHVALTVDGTLATLYVNGVARETATLGAPLPAARSNFKIGGDNRYGNTQYFKGMIYSAALFDTVRTAEQILADYTNGTAGAEGLLYEATLATEAEGEANEPVKLVGKTFHEENAVALEQLAGTPHTLEALLSLPKGMDGRGGVIVSNYDGGNGAQISLEIYTEGRVRLFYVSGTTRVSCVFATDIRSDGVTHIAVTVDGTTAKLYVNGNHVESTVLPVGMPEATEGYRIGGDARQGNAQYFKGTLYSVQLFSDVRTVKEIRRDMYVVMSDEEGLLLSTYFADTVEDACTEGRFHTESDWIQDTTQSDTQGGMMHKECTACGQVLAVREGGRGESDGFVMDYEQATGVTPEGQKDAVKVGDLAGLPLTFEVLMQLSSDYDGRAGVLVGNYNGSSKDQINIEIYTYGQVRLYFKKGGVSYAYYFNKVDVRSSDPVHLAVTVEGKTAKLYVDGALKQTITIGSTLPDVRDDWTVASDSRLENAQYFKGTVYAVNLFDHVRSAEEIALDAILVTGNTEGLLYSNYLQN